MDPHCPWTPLDGPKGRWTGVGIALAGSLGAALSGWLAGALLLGGRRLRRAAARPAGALAASSASAPPAARLLLLALALAALGRALLAGFPFATAAALAGRWVFGRGCCLLFAALRLLLEAAQRFAVTLLAIERCLVSRGTSGEPLCLRQYLWSIAACWTAATAWSTGPLLGWGKYGCDAMALWCELDWRPDGGMKDSFNVSFLLLGILAPEIIAWFCAMGAACRSYRPCAPSIPANSRTPGSELEAQDLDKTALLIATGHLLCGLPTLATQALLVAGERTLPTALRIAAPIALELLSCVPTVALLAAGPSVRAWLLGLPTYRRAPRRGRALHPAGARLLRTS